MATTFIDINQQSDLGRQMVRGGQLARESMQVVRQALAVFTTQVDGDGSNVSHFALPVSETTFPNTAAAKASWDESQSLNFVLGQAEAAILQWCAKHGV